MKAAAKKTSSAKKAAAKKPGAKATGTPAQKIEARIKELGDWRGETLAQARKIILQADPDIVEEWKWVKPTNPGVPVWSHNGIICTGETYKSAVKLTFAKGASLDDSTGMFNASLDGGTRRAIDFHEGDKIDPKALKALVRSAIALNSASKSARNKR